MYLGVQLQVRLGREDLKERGDRCVTILSRSPVARLLFLGSSVQQWTVERRAASEHKISRLPFAL